MHPAHLMLMCTPLSNGIHPPQAPLACLPGTRPGSVRPRGPASLYIYILSALYSIPILLFSLLAARRYKPFIGISGSLRQGAVDECPPRAHRPPATGPPAPANNQTRLLSITAARGARGRGGFASLASRLLY
jgi:hypothetical protein